MHQILIFSDGQVADFKLFIPERLEAVFVLCMLRGVSNKKLF